MWMALERDKYERLGVPFDEEKALETIKNK